MTASDLAKAAEGVTGETWTAHELHGRWFYYDGDEQVFLPGFDVEGMLGLGNHECGAFREGDARFIAFARNNWQRIVEVVRRAERAAEMLREVTNEPGVDRQTLLDLARAVALSLFTGLRPEVAPEVAQVFDRR